MMKKFASPDLTSVDLTDPVLGVSRNVCMKTTIPSVVRETVNTGRIAAFDLNWKPGMKNKPVLFWDSDVAKVMEGMAYTLALSPSDELEKIYDEWVDKICSAQQPDGYLNSFITSVDPTRRFTNLAGDHELYCAGHLIEAAVAGYVYLGKRKLLDCLCRYADYLTDVFGSEPGKRRGWPGHEEIELALAKLYHVTGEERYLKLMRYFINDRGTQPNVFAEQGHPQISRNLQAFAPVREQHEATGHVVRQLYLCMGMADFAALDDDASLLECCRDIFQDIVNKKMYITGGVGSCFDRERFTLDYDLPNGSMMYAESCANMALAFFAHRMFNLTGDNVCLDILERCLYNGVLSGISLSGDHFFYPNYLEVDDNTFYSLFGAKSRLNWFSCPCCPTSFARFLPQLGSFVYSLDPENNCIMLNIPAACRSELELNGKKIKLDVSGNYPFDGSIGITVGSDAEFTLKLRIPGWCRKYSVKLNGKTIESVSINRSWKCGDRIELQLDMPPEWVYSNMRVTGNAGRAAIMRGPVVYALEEMDQKYPVRELVLDTSEPLITGPAPDGLPSCTVTVSGKAWHETTDDPDSLYTTVKPTCTETSFTAVPYMYWQNRRENNMSVWNRCVLDFKSRRGF